MGCPETPCSPHDPSSLKADIGGVEGLQVKVLLRAAGATLAAAAAVVNLTAGAGADVGDKSRRGPAYSMTHPVVGRSSVIDTFGAPRSGGRAHAGQDVMAAKMQPLVAVVDGTVTRVTVPEPSYGYMLTLTGDDGWRFNYIHINNDTPGTDDGRASLEHVYGPGIAQGARVRVARSWPTSGTAATPRTSLRSCTSRWWTPRAPR
jgi:hypothetical protein